MIDVDEAGFERDVLQRSSEVPVVIDFWAEWCEPCKQLSPVLERLAHEYNGRFVLAKIDVDANQMLMQQFGIQGIPAVFAVVAGQALPLFQGAAPEAQIRGTLDQLIQVGEERFGLTGIAVDADAEGARAAEPEDVVPVGPYDALLEAAVQALDANDFGGAAQAYRNVLADDPGNTEAKLGLAQAELLTRVRDMDPQQVREDAAGKPHGRPGADRRGRPGPGRRSCGGRVLPAGRDGPPDGGRRPGRGARTAAGAVRGHRRGRPAGDGGAPGAGEGAVLTLRDALFRIRPIHTYSSRVLLKLGERGCCYCQ